MIPHRGKRWHVCLLVMMAMMVTLPFLFVVISSPYVEAFTITELRPQQFTLLRSQPRPRIQSTHQQPRSIHCRSSFWATSPSSSSASTSKSKSTAETFSSTQVLYQKVVKPSKALGLPDVLFLGYLVEYLESHFEIPNGLSMVYECLPGREETRSILAWDSPLSPSVEATRMEVEVVGIYTNSATETADREQSNEQQKDIEPAVPNMAMVVVRKAKPSSSASSKSLPPMMEGLFQDSEKKILKALDRGLEDFMAGKIQFDSNKAAQRVSERNVKTVDEAIDAELVDAPSSREKQTFSEKNGKDANDVVFDAYATNDDENEIENDETEKTTRGGKNTESKVTREKKPSPEAIAAAMATMKVKAQRENKGSVLSSSSDEKNMDKDADIPKPLQDFAVAAARKMRKKKKESQSVDYAVAAAKKISQTKLQKQKDSSSPKKNPEEEIETNQSENEATETPMGIPSNFKVADYMGDKRAFRTTISRPKDRRTKGKNMQQSVLKSTGPSNKIKRVSMQTAAAKKETLPIDSNASFSMKVQSNEKEQVKNSQMEPSEEDIEKEVIKAAQQAMSEMAAQGEISPEDLLKDVLKFGEEKEKEATPGNGFVSAAFDKAKDLIRQQNEKQQGSRNLKFKDPISPIENIRPNIVEEESKNVSTEEELRQMFEAGERIADGRIAVAEETSDAVVDSLVEKEKSVSSYARSLDDGLAELEIAVNNSPDEHLDGPLNSPLFDIMAGPEVYNPNVDLDAVNYPGALPGTKDVKLPKELEDAIRQAEFAVEVLSELRSETDEKSANAETKHFYGKQEISEQQVQQLETVAKEAIELGIIKDPIKLVDESSRLQMLCDELRAQPEERFRDIAESDKDLLLSDNFVYLIKARLRKMADRDLDALRRDDESLKEPHERERVILSQLVVYAQLLLKEVRALGAELEAQQLEVIRSICQVAMDPKHQSEEEAAIALSDSVRDMRPLLDDSFVAYLKYAIAEEEARLARATLLDDPEHNQWLFVLKIVQQGVYAEIAKSINRYIDHISYVIRMETPRERRMLLSNLIDDMPTMDVRPFVKVVQNIVSSLGDFTRGEFDEGQELGEMTNKLLQLHRDVRELLPPERIAEKSKDADEWAARQKERLLEARKIGKQRLKAANDVADRQEEIDAIGRRGEVERFD